MNSLVGDMAGEEIAEALENAPIIYDMFASCQTNGSSININLEKLNAVQVIGLDIKQTIEAQIDTIITAYENMGYTDTQVEYQKMTVDGKEFDSLCLTAQIEGIDFYAHIFTFRKGSYLANVTLCSMGTDTTDTIVSYFTVQ